MATVERINWINAVLLVLTLIVTFGMVFLLDAMLARREFQQFEITFTERVHFLAKSIGAAYFQWTEMYDAIVGGDDEFVNREFGLLVEDFPFVKSVSVEDGYPPEGFFEIRGRGEHLILRYRILDSRGERHVCGKFAILVLDVRELLEYFNVKNFRLSSDGVELAFGLKFVREDSIVSTSLFVAIALSVALVVLVLVLFNERTILRRYRETVRSLEIQKSSLKAIHDITVELLRGTLEPSYQYIIERAVQIVPGAQAGSILVMEGDKFVYAGCVNYDFEELSKVKFSFHELAQGFDDKVKVITDIGNYDRLMLEDEGMLEILRNAGRVEEIRAMLSVPVKVRGRVIAFVNLDNFESENAFDDTSVELAEIFASQVGVLFERIELERELSKQKERLEHLSTHDELTGLANRRLLEIESEKSIALARREGKKICVIYLDLEKFKPINDKYGHKFGDYVLQVIARRLQNSARKSDVVARLGGDEFVFVLYDCKDYLHFVERVSAELRKPIYHNYEEVHVSGNFGIAIFPDNGESFEKLLIEADKAMYYAKTNGLLYWQASLRR